MAKYEPKTHLVRSPTLLIGVGGIGGEIVKAVNAAMSDYDRSCVSMLVMDTDSEAIDRASDANIPYIQTSENQTVSAYLEANPEFYEWFPTDPLINAKNLIQGAGQIRSVSRLGALASKMKGRFELLKRAINDILKNQGDSVNRAVRVMIVGSVTGGTGSGLGIQLPFYIRKLLKDANVPNVLIRGLFLMPSLTQEKQYTDAKKSAVNVNGYAFLKELNAFYRAQKTEKEDNLLRVEEYVPGMQSASGQTDSAVMAAMIPYDFLYLVEKQSSQGNLGPMENYIGRASKIVLNQLFSPISSAGFSAEDNLITSIVPAGGMNRYCGAGISTAIYPKDEVVRYCTVRYAGEMIGNYWLRVDEIFKQRDEQQRRLKKTNPHLMPLDRGNMYCQIFDEMCDPTKSDVVGEVAALKGELTVLITNQDNRVVEKDLIDHLVTNIERRLGQVYNGSVLPSMADKCKMTATDKNIPEDVAADANKRLDNLRAFKAQSEKTVSELTVATAEEILPADLKTAQGSSRDAGYNLYMALEKKHPIITRYILYRIRKDLMDKKRQVDAKLNSANARLSVFDKDYLYQGNGDNRKESPSEAISKVKPGLFAAIGLHSAAYKNKVQEIVDDVAGEAQHYSDMAKNSLASVVYRIVLERLDVLIGLYERFFEELVNIMEQKHKEADRLEVGRGEGRNEVFVGDRYICSNATCKKHLYDEFTRNVTDEEMEMSDNVKKGFFDKMYGEYQSLLIQKANPTAIVPHLSYNELFEAGVLNPIVAQFANGGFKHLDMNILDAIYKQYLIESKNPNATKDCADFKEYFRKICTNLCALAEPYMLYECQVPGYVSGGHLNYAWGLNHVGVVEHQTGSVEGDMDATKLQGMFASGSTTPLADDSFSPYELVCYATIFDLRIENCMAYRVGSPAQEKYAQRLQNLVNREFVLGANRDAELDVIHPHLDRHWHEHAYLPELMGYDDEKMCKDIRLAFLLAMALKRCKYVVDTNEGLSCWCFIESSERTGREQLTPIYVDGKELEARSIFALYNAFDRNRVMVADVLSFAVGQLKKAYDESSFAGVTAEGVLEQTIIKGMMGQDDNRTLLDILYDLYRGSGNRELTTNLINTLEEYLHEYCLKMMNGNENKAAVLAKTVFAAIGNAAEVQKDDTATFFREMIANFC